MNLAITGSYPHTAISYPLVVISKGPLPAAENASAAVTQDGNITFTWTDNSGTGTAKAGDKVILVAYFPDVKQAVFNLHAATRGDWQATLDTKAMHGHAAETWIGFLSADEKDAANSVYTGSVLL